jgi:hypothetical protein
MRNLKRCSLLWATPVGKEVLADEESGVLELIKWSHPEKTTAL